jgi:[pyruvate, water dikinase]-phosphate phosphotransferase / [pyruvate, water dikinase] kinase
MRDFFDFDGIIDRTHLTARGACPGPAVLTKMGAARDMSPGYSDGLRFIPIAPQSFAPDLALARNYFHLHLISDATGETLIAVSRAVVAQYDAVESIEHLYPFVRSAAQLEKAIAEVDEAPGVVLFTLVDKDLARRLIAACHELNVPCHSVLQPISDIFRAYLGSPGAARPGAQHTLNAYYFNRVEALNYTMMHDDGQMADDYEIADVILLGVSRTSKTPTSIYLANRGIKTANIPIIPNVPLTKSIFSLKKPLIVGLITSSDRLVTVRQQRLDSSQTRFDSTYVDPVAVNDEVVQSRRLFAHYGWPVIDVTRRSIEETAAAVINLYKGHRARLGFSEAAR